MHPNRALHWDDCVGMRGFVRAHPFGQLFATTPDGPRVAQMPVVWLDEETIGLHLARTNALAPHLDGATALFTVLGPDGYISPEWNGLDRDQVPTWNYVAVELEGTAHAMDRDALLAQIDQLGAENEASLPKTPWTRDKVDPAKIEAMLRGITGFRLEIAAWRGTRKLAQTKPAAARLAAADASEAAGRPDIARLMREWD